VTPDTESTLYECVVAILDQHVIQPSHAIYILQCAIKYFQNKQKELRHTDSTAGALEAGNLLREGLRAGCFAGSLKERVEKLVGAKNE